MRPSLTDRQAWLLAATVLFLTAAWPLLVVDVPPFQDLPNHLATARILQEPSAFPEYAVNGYFKTNSALFLWLELFGRIMSLRAAAKLFVALVLAANALLLPKLVLEINGRSAMVRSLVCAWPLVHHWFVSMGMLDFSLGIALVLVLVLVLVRQARTPSWPRALVIAAVAVLLWLTHAFALLVALLLAGMQFLEADRRVKRTLARLALAPLVPVVPLLGWSIVEQLRQGAGRSGWTWAPPWELLYNAWAESLWAFTSLELPTLLVAVVLLVWLVRERTRPTPVLSRNATLVMGALYVVAPYHAANWFHVGARFLPFLWVSALVRVPERVPRALAASLAAAWLFCSVGMGVDYARLGAALERFASGSSAVPEGASLLPLMFASKEGSTNTSNMLHAWGLYVLDRKVHSPLVFAHSRSFPITLREAPPPALEPLALERFALGMARDRCATTESSLCEQTYGAAWRAFWTEVEPRFDHVLLYAAPPSALRHVPASYGRVFESGRVVVFARQGSSRAASSSISKPSE